eukprot:TRINITY_DN12062_c0_g2_i1.p1 TRINITY_DN12062_c0_g2~~TRINITY_DN12062_c0_g2_i1.p1  ORF type:complete len:730 (+),score=24.45 TRINITY_DN12062_c0_g2_i1:27-2216(+)
MCNKKGKRSRERSTRARTHMRTALLCGALLQLRQCHAAQSVVTVDGSAKQQSVPQIVRAALALPLSVDASVRSVSALGPAEWIRKPSSLVNGSGNAGAVPWDLVQGNASGGYVVVYSVPMWKPLLYGCLQVSYKPGESGERVCQTTMTVCGKPGMGTTTRLAAADGTVWRASCAVQELGLGVVHSVRCDGPQCDRGAGGDERLELCGCDEEFDTAENCGCAEIYPVSNGEACLRYEDVYQYPLEQGCARQRPAGLPDGAVWVSASKPTAGPLVFTWCVDPTHSDSFTCAAPPCEDSSSLGACCMYASTVRQQCDGVCQSGAHGIGKEASAMFTQYHCANDDCSLGCTPLRVNLGECTLHAGSGSVMHTGCDSVRKAVIETLWRSSDCSGSPEAEHVPLPEGTCATTGGSGYRSYKNLCDTGRSCTVQSGPPPAPSPSADLPAQVRVLVPVLIGGMLSMCCCCMAAAARRFQRANRRGAAAAPAAADAECSERGCSNPAAFGDLCDKHAPKCAARTQQGRSCAVAFVRRPEHACNLYCEGHACEKCGALGVYSCDDGDDGDLRPQMCAECVPCCAVPRCGSAQPRTAGELFCDAHRCTRCPARAEYMDCTGPSCSEHWLISPTKAVARVLWLAKSSAAGRSAVSLSIQDGGESEQSVPGRLQPSFDCLLARRSGDSCDPAFADAAASLGEHTAMLPSQGSVAAKTLITLGARAPVEVWSQVASYVSCEGE